MAEPKDGRPRLRRLAAVTAGVALSAAFTANALAAPITLQAVNSRGVQQASLVSLASTMCGGSCGTAGTDANGRLTLDVQPGEELRITRGSLAPEGTGVAYTVPNPPPAAPVTVTLPALPGAVAPGIDAAEAWLLTRVNEARGSMGRSALRLSSTLSRAADAYAHYLAATGQFSHTALADPGVRAVDQGWPVPGGSGVGEALALAPSKELAYQGWQASGPHWTLLMTDGLDSVGVGRAGGRWIMMPAACGLASSPERCGLGADPAVVPPGSRGPVGPGVPDVPSPLAAKRTPRLAVRLRRHGRRLVVTVRVRRGEGRVRVAVRSGRRHARLRHRGKAGLHRFTARLPKRGRWKVRVRFDGAAGWADRRLRARTVRWR